MATIAYRKGPLGYAVILDGKPVGRIADRRNHGCWQVDVPGLNATEATRGGKLFRGTTTFTTLAEAKAAVKRVLTPPVVNTDGGSYMDMRDTMKLLEQNEQQPITALRALAQFCIDNGFDSFVWTLRNGPPDPDGGVTDWRVEIRPALPKGRTAI